MITEQNYLNIWHVINNEIIGDLWLTMFVLLFLMTWISIRYRWDWRITAMMLFIAFAVIYSKAPQLALIWVVLLFVISVYVYYQISKLWVR